MFWDAAKRRQLAERKYTRDDGGFAYVEDSLQLLDGAEDGRRDLREEVGAPVEDAEEPVLRVEAVAPGLRDLRGLFFREGDRDALRALDDRPGGLGGGDDLGEGVSDALRDGLVCGSFERTSRVGGFAQRFRQSLE